MLQDINKIYVWQTGGKRWNLKNPDLPADKQVLMTKAWKCGKVREEMMK